MKQKTLNIIFIILLIILFVIVGVLLFKKPIEKTIEKPVNNPEIISRPLTINNEDSDKFEVVTETKQGNIACRENSKYLVLIKQPEAGVSSLLIKNKTNSQEKIACNYIVDQADFELKNLEATYFLALVNNFLVLDIGTGPARNLIVYNLENRQQIFTDGYSDLTSNSANTITYWASTDQKTTTTNCPKLNEYLSGGLGAAIEARVSLNLKTLVKKELGEFRCAPRQ